MVAFKKNEQNSSTVLRLSIMSILGVVENLTCGGEGEKKSY